MADGAHGVGSERQADGDNLPEQRIGRHSPALFKLGATESHTLFHDGRLQLDAQQPDGIRTPLGAEMVAGFSGVLSAQSMFRCCHPTRWQDTTAENKITQAVRRGVLTGPGGAWDRIAQRVLAAEPYKEALQAVFGENTNIGFTHISDALAAFMAVEWRADNSVFDRYLRDGLAMNDTAMRGMELFYGKANCDQCHSGQFQTDHDFHATGGSRRTWLRGLENINKRYVIKAPSGLLRSFQRGFILVG